MQSIRVSGLLLIIYVIVDDCYQQHGQVLLQGKVGKKLTFSDCDVITLLLAQDYIPFPGENQFIGLVRANYLDSFPDLVDQSQFNRRARALRLLLVEMRRHWLGELGLVTDLDLLLDTKPVPVMGYKRSKKRSGFANRAGYGVCVSRNLMYFGYKLVTLSNFHGIPVVYELVAANSDERLAAQSVLYAIRGCRVYGDKGFIGEDWQAIIFGQTDNPIYTAKRSIQCNQNPADFDRWLNSVRERIEGVFNELQNTGRNLERLLAKPVLGLVIRVIANLTSHLLKYILRTSSGIDFQSFTKTR